MKKFKLAVGCAALFVAIAGITYVLKSEHALIVHPKGVIARKELQLMITNIFLMLLVILPTFVLLFVVGWRYWEKKSPRSYNPTMSSAWVEAMLWMIPSIVIAVMTVITWKKTHELDPYQPIISDVQPIHIQVIAMDWKWLFIYPEQKIASLNFVQFPEKTPVKFSLSADGSPMNSFWIPELSGQIYSMTGMITPLYVMADKPGVYSGKAAEINGAGYADMTFIAQSSSLEDFDAWIEKVKQSSEKLTENTYNSLVKAAIDTRVVPYSEVDEDLFSKVVMKYMHPE